MANEAQASYFLKTSREQMKRIGKGANLGGAVILREVSAHTHIV